MFLGLGVGINRHLFSRGVGKLTPCLENLSFWSDTLDIANKLFTAQVGTDVPIENTNVMYFDGTSNGIATLTHEAIPTVTDVEVYFSADNITWVNTGAYNIVDDTLTIGYNGSSYVAGYYSVITVIKNTNSILQFTLAENNIIENINRLDDYISVINPGGQITATVNFSGELQLIA